MDRVKDLTIKLTPWLDESYTFLYCDVDMCLKEPKLEKGCGVASLWKNIAGVPCSKIDGGDPEVRDETGLFLLKKVVEKEMGFDKTVWILDRASSGDVSISYRFFPRDMEGVKGSHPFFDVIAEPNGALIPGVTTLVRVPDGKYRIRITWDNSQMPDGAGTASIKGSGNIEYTGTPVDYTFTLYLAGKYKCAEDPTGKYRIYWLADELPDGDKAAAQIPPLISEMCRFFKDEDLRYSIFFRKEPFYMSNGGTAFDGGFAFGYSDAQPLNVESALNTIAHEITHNWPALEDIDGEGTWYAEGTAEYYSMMIPLRSGIASAQQVADWLTEKSVNYYNNPYQNLGNLEVYSKRPGAMEPFKRCLMDVDCSILQRRTES